MGDEYNRKLSISHWLPCPVPSWVPNINYLDLGWRLIRAMHATSLVSARGFEMFLMCLPCFSLALYFLPVLWLLLLPIYGCFFGKEIVLRLSIIIYIQVILSSVMSKYRVYLMLYNFIIAQSRVIKCQNYYRQLP